MWMPTIVFDEEACISRERLLLAFQEEGIDARIFFWPLSSLPMFTSAKYNKNAWSIPERAINLPSFHDISDESLQRVIAVIKGLVK
jgi:perosamine synthetase